MTETHAPDPPELRTAKPSRKRGPKPAADLDAVTRVGAEFRAIDPGARPVGMQVVRMHADFSRLAAACESLTDDQRRLAIALCEALSK